MAISYQKLREVSERWGIDVAVRFSDVGIDITKTFSFANKEQITKDFGSRMLKAISNIEARMEAEKKPADSDIFVRCEKHFEANPTMSKAEYELIKNTLLSRSIHG